ncbi:hypothetical protein P5G51_019415 [Virgibacillus sp. 179-BFC.A HS]|uniref:Lipoprotein n=1 Tax=Tigheibacillus jepli TaxID=3035914 RepID=A0ABU5CLU8_9BACI|nr:hypothetical protein [Virgibacillus sp. 179-BFC.A HS]MDY0407210.1 hypothetical protein [Virgibacillus sp. 179-BFC.A HS]
MKKIGLTSLMLLAFLLLLSACGNKAEVGMNKISLKELEEKLDNNESFLLVTFSASGKDVEESELVEAFNESLSKKEQTAFYVNLDGENQKTLDQLGEKYTPSEYKGDVWEPKDDGLVLIEDGGVMKNPRETLLGQPLIEGTANGADGYGTSFMEYMDDIDAGISSALDFAQQNDIELTY